MLIEGRTPSDARKRSVELIKAHRRSFFFSMLGSLVVIALIQAFTEVIRDRFSSATN